MEGVKVEVEKGRGEGRVSWGLSFNRKPNTRRTHMHTHICRHTCTHTHVCRSSVTY